MSRTTGPILAIGGITLTNRLLHDQPLDLRIPLAVGISAMGFALLERVWPKGAVALSWAALVTVLMTRLDPAVPAPVESINTWWKEQR